MKSYDKKCPESIQTMFGSIAPSYDRTNAILSFQMHRYWNRALKAATISNSNKMPHSTIADLCCGTGTISLPWLAGQDKRRTAYLVDFCPEMLNVAKEKASKLKLTNTHDINYLNADVQAIPIENDTIDFCTMAYGIRNVKSPKKCFEEVHRILKEGGTFGILELTEPKNRFLRFGHRLYLKTMLPLLGKIFASNGDAYRYLCQSIHAFIKPHDLKKMLEESGFHSVEIRPLSLGIATLIIAKKI